MVPTQSKAYLCCSLIGLLLFFGFLSGLLNDQNCEVYASVLGSLIAGKSECLA